MTEQHAEQDVVRALSRVLRAHGGGLELLSQGPDAEVRFTGMCAGCPCRPLCLDNLVGPALLALDTVTSVTAPGTRTDPSALDRFRALSRGGASQDPALHHQAQSLQQPLNSHTGTTPA